LPRTSRRAAGYELDDRSFVERFNESEDDFSLATRTRSDESKVASVPSTPGTEALVGVSAERVAARG
jgi:hypothetical protein